MIKNNGFVPYLRGVSWNIGMCLGKACSVLDSKRPIFGYPTFSGELIRDEYSSQTTSADVKTLSHARSIPDYR